jgi:hypothetical protein
MLADGAAVWLRPGWLAEEPCSAVAAAGSGCAVFGFDAMLAEQGMKALDFIAELAELLGKGRQVRVRGCPLLLARGPLSKQVLFPVAQRRGPLILLGGDGGVPVALRLLDLLVQLTGVRPGPCALLDSGHARVDRVEAGGNLRRQPRSRGAAAEPCSSSPRWP